MRMILTALLALWTLAACAASATGAQNGDAQSARARDCFRNVDVRGYNVIDNTHVRLSVGANRQYLLTTGWNARDLDWRQRIAIRSTNGWICVGNGLGVEVVGGEPHRRYPIVEIARAPEAQPEAQGS